MNTPEPVDAILLNLYISLFVSPLISPSFPCSVHLSLCLSLSPSLSGSLSLICLFHPVCLFVCLFVCLAPLLFYSVNCRMLVVTQLVGAVVVFWVPVYESVCVCVCVFVCLCVCVVFLVIHKPGLAFRNIHLVLVWKTGPICRPENMVM